MISFIQPIAAGNALRIFLEPPARAEACRVLRKGSDEFKFHDDPTAFVVSANLDTAALDFIGLVNGTLYHYRAFYLVDGAWTSERTVSAVPNATYEGMGTDVLSLVRDRLDLGLQEELRRGVLGHDDGHIKVLTAPPVSEESWPLVTVHLNSESPAERAIGEMIDVDEFADGEWTEKEGWIARTQLTIMAWCLNPDERIAVRQSLGRIVKANFPIFDFAGMFDIEFSQQDTEDFGSFSAPVYQVLCTLSCSAPSQVGVRVGAIKEVHSTLEVNNE